MIKDFKNVLVFAAHHDDETLGCGATISKLSDLFSNITVVFFTNGDTGIDQTKKYEKNIVATRKQEANEAAKILGISNIVELNHPCQKLENTQKTLHNTIQVIRSWKPDLVLTHSPNDVHRDHKVAHSLVEESYYKSYENIHPELGKCHKPALGLCYEVFQQHASPDVYVSVSESDIDKKIAAFEKYNSQHDLLSQDNSVINYLRSLAKVRGFSAGLEYCESFTFLGRNRLTL
jgi:N-acetylglucosamine malate deacetylase 1